MGWGGGWDSGTVGGAGNVGDTWFSATTNMLTKTFASKMHLTLQATSDSTRRAMAQHGVILSLHSPSSLKNV